MALQDSYLCEFPHLQPISRQQPLLSRARHDTRRVASMGEFELVYGMISIFHLNDA